jgi:hypothetical protein
LSAAAHGAADFAVNGMAHSINREGGQSVEFRKGRRGGHGHQHTAMPLPREVMLECWLRIDLLI